LLWRGSRDGFGVTEFHRRCDVYANTLTLIFDTKGNSFGGFSKADNSLTSFLFTLTNSHNVPARRFLLKAEQKEYAIYCDWSQGPVFGKPNFVVLLAFDNCSALDYSHTSRFGETYSNDSGLEPRQGGYSSTLLTGTNGFQVREIEVFEIAQ
jgi:hypothetical protein